MVGEGVKLSPQEFQLFTLLRTHSHEPSKYLSIPEITKELGAKSSRETKKLLSALQQRPGIVLHSEARKGSETVYSLSPETLEVLVRQDTIGAPNPEQPKWGALYLAEPAFGTKAYDPKAMKGLALALQVNRLAPLIQHVFVQGGVVPHVPPFNSATYNNDLKFLGWVPRTDARPSLSEQFIEGKIEDVFEQEWYQKHVNNKDRRKITNLTDAFQAAEQELRVLSSVLSPDAVLAIQLGEEEHKNIRHAELDLIKRWADEYKELIEAQSEEISGDLEEAQSKLSVLATTRAVYSSAQRDRKLLQQKDEEREDYERRLRKAIRGYGVRVSNERLSQLAHELERTLHGKDYKTVMSERVKALELEESKLEQEVASLESKMRDLERDASWDRTLTERRSITNFTRQYKISADAAEVAFVKAKNDFTRNFYGWTLPVPVVVHVSPRKKIHLDTNIIPDITKGQKLGVDVEYEERVQEDGKRIWLIHNIASTSSDSASSTALKEAKIQSNIYNMVLEKLVEGFKGTHPDIILLGGHGIGGFRVQPWFQQTEDIGDGKFVQDRPITYLMHLPTFQSREKLDWLVNHNFKNWHTKRFAKGPYATGAVVHIERQGEAPQMHFYDHDLLLRFGALAEEIDVYRAELQKKGVPKEEKQRLFSLINERMKDAILSYKTIEAGGDDHLGAPDYPTRISKDQFIKAYQTYQREHGLPAYASWDEILHGAGALAFASSTRRYGHLAEEFFQDVIQKVTADTTLTDAQRVKILAREALSTLRASTLDSVDDQLKLFNLLLKPYAEEVLKAGGKLILTSGNHHNKSQRYLDEATFLCEQFDRHYIKSGAVIANEGKGNDFGAGVTILDGKAQQKLFVMHRFPVQQDEGYGILAHLRRMNSDADIVLAGDRHQPSFGAADGHVYALHPGMEPINKYCPVVGKPSGVRGIINVKFDPNVRGAYVFEPLFNDTLEHVIRTHNII